MQLEFTKSLTQGNPTLTMRVVADDDEKDIFIELGFDKMKGSDELLQKYFSYHQELFNAVGINRNLWDSYHSGDNQFSNTCSGFGNFLRNISSETLEKLVEAVLQKINLELGRRSSTLTSVRTVMLSETKRLPVTEFDLTDPSMRLQIGNKVFELNPLEVDGSNGVIQCIKQNAQDTIKTFRTFYEQSNQRLLQDIEQGYKSEIQRIKERYRDSLLFPRWLTRDATHRYKIQAFYLRDNQLSYALPFKYTLTTVKVGSNVYNLKSEYKEEHDCLIQMIVQNNRFSWATLVKLDFTNFPNMHTLERHLCMGSYRVPNRDITNSEHLVEIRNDLQRVLSTADLGNLGNESQMNDRQRHIRHAYNDGNLGEVADTRNPITIHHLGRRS